MVGDMDIFKSLKDALGEDPTGITDIGMEAVNAAQDFAGKTRAAEQVMNGVAEGAGMASNAMGAAGNAINDAAGMVSAGAELASNAMGGMSLGDMASAVSSGAPIAVGAAGSAMETLGQLVGSMDETVSNTLASQAQAMQPMQFAVAVASEGADKMAQTVGGMAKSAGLEI